MSIGKKLKMLRSKSDLSLDELATHLNKSINKDEKQYVMFNKVNCQSGKTTVKNQNYQH